MLYLASIELTNFQRYRKLHLDFVPGTNVLAGTSDQGKSTVLRAIKWVLRNKPRGLASIRYDHILAGASSGLSKDDLTSVVLTRSDGNTVTRERNEKGINRYVVNGEDLEAMGSSVPQQVLDIFPIEDFCIQEQHDIYFLLQDTAGDVARKIDSVAGLQIIGRSLQRANSWLSEGRNLVKTSKGIVAKKTEEINALLWLDDAGGFLTEVEAQEQIRAESLDSVDKLEALVGDLSRYQGDLSEVIAWLDIEKDAMPVFELLAQAEGEKKELEDLERLASEVRVLLRMRGQREIVLGIEAPLKSLMESVIAWKQTMKQVGKLAILCESVGKLSKKFEYADKKVRVAKDKRERRLKELKVCPLCGSAL